MNKTYLIVLLMLMAGKMNGQSIALLPGMVESAMTTAQRMALVSPAAGTLVFDTDTQSYWVIKNGIWAEYSNASPGLWTPTNGTNFVSNTNAGGFWSKNPVRVDLFAPEGTYPPVAPINEKGTRLMWIPSRSAFRVGTVTDSACWAPANIGLFSFANGFNNRASERGAVAIGTHSIARNFASLAIGTYAEAGGSFATAMGTSTAALGEGAFVMGEQSTAYGDYSVAIGKDLVASGNHSKAMGYRMDTNHKKGAVMIGDYSSGDQGTTFAELPDQFVARFNQGYYLMTSGNQFRTGISIGRLQSDWNTISDSTRKEKFVKADGREFLQKLRQLRLGSWNYKHAESTQPQRFYGPMAQEIYAAFGKDEWGTIGNDTTVSTLNMDGLLFIFSQTLEQQTHELQAENNKLRSILKHLYARMEALEADLDPTSLPQKTRLYHSTLANRKKTNTGKPDRQALPD
ncbi:tail fiber domain-containing protein [Emticicia agri]|uniref:Peptidase S74 domain-containing protein n=1 Tax=Emticicia agri TaxID=2492393 RepID=A0A4Q5LTZ2_9BACT|nr:tail fiber domain-containing protein [Emticicia agri]RYU93052.1 hypothetical protein EWM59_23985 [Emticicia agri]